MWYLTPEI